MVICEPYHWFWNKIGHTAGVHVSQETGVVSAFESTSVSKLTGVKGVQLNPMGAWVEAYPGKVGIRRLAIKDLMTSKSAIEARAERFIRDTRGTSYPDIKQRAGRWYLIKAAWDGILLKKLSENTETDRWIFCTDLMARWYRAMGLILQEVNCAEMQPDDMYEGGFFDTHLGLCGIAELSEIIWIKE